MDKKCDKCRKRKASYFHTSATEPTINLCSQCEEEYDTFMREAEAKFFGRAIGPKPKYVNSISAMLSRLSVPEIKIGDKLKCLNCKKPILLNKDTFKANESMEYIHCPYCKVNIDVQQYHILREKEVD